MINNKDLDEILCLYDKLHYERNGKVRLNVDVKSDFVFVTVESNSDKKCFKFDVNPIFENKYLSLLSLHFFSFNKDLTYRKLLASENGNIIFENNREILIIRNINPSLMEKISLIKSTVDGLRESKNFESIYKKYVITNICMTYAKYRRDFYDVTGRLNFFDKRVYKTYLESDNREDDTRDENFIILDIARCALALVADDNYDLIKNEYYDDYIVVNHISKFENAPFDSIYGEALVCAEYEQINENILIDNKDMVLELIGFIKDNANLSFEEYWDGRRRFYKIFENSNLEEICDDILNNCELREKCMDNTEIIDTQSFDNNFKNIINNPIEKDNVVLFEDKEHEILAKKGEEQAKLIMKMINEKNELKKDAEEFAKIILKKQKEYKEIMKAAEEQAKRIMTLEKENEKLKALAEENAMNIFLRDKKNEDEMYLRDIKDNTPISKSDIDKIGDLLNALSDVKDLDFVVNHPTVASKVYELEEKIITYLTTHKNVIDEVKDKDVLLTQNEKTKTPIELLSIIRNVYLESHNYEKDGRHTVINVSPHFDKYRVVIYSVKDDNDDVLTDVYFDKIFFNEDVIKEICDIYSKDATIVASKTDNIPDDLADFLVIDNMDNALKFTGCKRFIIQIAKAYL